MAVTWSSSGRLLAGIEHEEVVFDGKEGRLPLRLSCCGFNDPVSGPWPSRGENTLGLGGVCHAG